MRDRGKEVERLYGYHIAVCEDDPFIRDRICQVCEETLSEEKIDYEIIPFSDAEQLEAILDKEGEIFDLLILDIKLQNKSGMKLAEELREKENRVSIIFVTGYETYLAKGYEVQPVHFLLKPLKWEELRKAVLTDWKLNHRPRMILLEKGRRKLRLPLDAVLYAEPDGNHGTRIILKDRIAEFSAGITELTGMLPEGQFIRCHNSYVVNLEHVEGVSWLSFQMDNGEKIPISRKYYNVCQNAFISYMNR